MSKFKTNILKIKAWTCSLPAQQAQDKPGRVATGQLQLHHLDFARFCDKSSSASLQRQTQTTNPHLPSKPITGATSPSGTHIHKHRGAQMHKVIQPNKLRAWSKCCLSRPPQSCLRKVHCETHQSEPTQEHLLFWKRSAPRAVRHIRGCRENVFQDFTRILMGIFRGRI